MRLQSRRAGSTPHERGAGSEPASVPSRCLEGQGRGSMNRRKALGSALIAAALLVGCHTITEELPTQPTKEPSSGVLTVPIPTIPLSNPPTPTPTPTATPTPGPGPTPEPEPTPEPDTEPEEPPDSSGCGRPQPPELTRLKVKIHLKGPRMATLDSTPLVGPDAGYCAKIGFTDGRSFCPVRPEGAPDREACEAKVVGRAEDTGRPGPTWTREGHYCKGESSGCENNPDNQYLLWAYEGGSYQACAKNGVCGDVEVDR